MKRETIDFIFIAFLILVILGLLYVIKVEHRAASEPLIFGAEELSKANNADVYCSCSIMKKPFPVIIDFTSFNDTLNVRE